MMLAELIHNSKLNKFCSFVKFYNLNKGAKVCGVDLQQDYINFKLYIELLEIPSTEIINEFLEPNAAAEFLKWVPFWDETRKSGLAFGLKVDTSNIHKKYFHIKFKKNFNSLLFDKQFLFLKLLKINAVTLLKGISYEIETDNNFYEKFYVYIKDPLEIKKVLCYKKMLHKLDINEIEELELYATKNSFKVNVINKLDNFTVKQNIWQTIPDNLTHYLKECITILNCNPMYTGITSSGVVSAYFSFTKKDNNILDI